jgi:TetR/AcrR family tetracycline transcriptional repressor
MDGVHSARERRRGAPPAGQRLTRDTVTSRAAQLIASDGLAAFSLRGLADALGVAPNALYNHFRSRDDLLDAVADRFAASITLPASEQPWPDWVRAAASGLRAQLTSQPGITGLLLARAGSTAAGPKVLARFIDRLVSAGLDRALAHVAWHAVLTVVIGSAAQEQARGTDGEPTFQAILDITIAGLHAAARHPPSARSAALLHAHALARE